MIGGEEKMKKLSKKELEDFLTNSKSRNLLKTLTAITLMLYILCILIFIGVSTRLLWLFFGWI